MHCKFNLRNLFRSPQIAMPLNNRKKCDFFIFYSFSLKSKVKFGLNKIMLFVNINQGMINLCYVYLEAIKSRRLCEVQTPFSFVATHYSDEM